MLSAFNTKFKALQGKVPQSALNTPWRKALFWIIATAAILTSFLLIILWDVFKAMILDSNSGDEPRNDEGRDANGYMPGSPYYSKQGSINPMLIELWDANNNKDHF